MTANIPPAPPLPGNAVLEVFTHHSVPATAPDSPGSGARLRVLGKSMLEMAYVAALIKKRPNLPGYQLQQYIDINYPVFVACWVNAYQWKTRVQMTTPPNVNLDDPEEMRKIFEAYAGAVAHEYGPDPRGQGPNATSVLEGWIQTLVYMSD